MNMNIEYRQAEIDAIHAEIFGKKTENSKQEKTSTKRTYDDGFIKDEDVLLDKMFKSKNGDKIQRLYNGDWSDYPSQSDGDQGLCNHLAFWFNKDFARMDSIFRSSGLMRDKWDEKHYSGGQTYGQHTIEKAIADTSTTYQEGKERHKKERRAAAEATASAAGITTRDIISAAYYKQKGCADLYILINKGNYRYDHAAGIWYAWGAHYWKREGIDQPLKDCDALLVLFEACRDELNDQKAESLKTKREDDPEIKKIDADLKAVNDQIGALKNLYYRKQVIEFAAVGAGSLGTSGDEWDALPWTLPCSNVVVDLKTGISRPGRQSDMLKTHCPTAYNPLAECERFKQALIEIFNGDYDLIWFFQRLMGLGLIGEVVEHILPILWGSGRNGKDTLMEAFLGVLGDMMGPVRADMLLDSGQKRNAGAPNAEVMALRGKRIVWASESNEGRKLDAARVKELTGGGNLSGREPYGRREVSFKPSHLLLMLTNAKPRVNADDYAMWKRLHLIPFNVSFVDDPKAPHERLRDKALPEALKAEAEGILAWLVQGCLDYQAEGLNPPECVTSATLSYQKDEDVLNHFYEDCCVINPEAHVIGMSLFNEYCRWATANGLKAMTNIGFAKKVNVRFPSKQMKIDGKNNKVFRGIGLLDHRGEGGW